MNIHDAIAAAPAQPRSRWLWLAAGLLAIGAIGAVLASRSDSGPREAEARASRQGRQLRSRPLRRTRAGYPRIVSLTPARLAAGALGSGYAIRRAPTGPAVASVLSAMGRERSATPRRSCRRRSRNRPPGRRLLVSAEREVRAVRAGLASPTVCRSWPQKELTDDGGTGASEGDEREFPSPFEVAIPPRCEGWEEMYPYHAVFGESRRDFDDRRFWFQERVHDAEPLYRFDAVTIDSALVALNQANGRLSSSLRPSGTSSGS